MKSLKVSCLLIFVIIIYSCNNESSNVNALKSIGASSDERIDYEILSSETYRSEALSIIESGKRRLKDLLPNVVEGQMKMYEKTLLEIEAQPIKTLSFQDSNSEIQRVKNDALDSLLIDELRVNQVFYETINELTLLNLKYNKSDSTIVFQDYYDTKPFILAEEVVEKMEELLFDEKERIKREDQDNYISAAAALTSFIPLAGIAAKLATVASKMKALKKAMPANTIASKFLKEKVLPTITNQISNHTKRVTLEAQARLIPGKAINGAKYVMNKDFSEVNQKEIQKTALDFKSPDNELPGRIKDFSDGVITQPIANLRLMMKQNVSILEKHNLNSAEQ